MTRSSAIKCWLAVVFTFVSASAVCAEDEAVLEEITHHTASDSAGETVEYLIHEPRTVVPQDQRTLIVFLHGAGGSLTNYNLTKPPFAKVRSMVSERGWYIAVPYLGGRHFMNDAAKTKLDAVIEKTLAEREIPASRVHLMGVSMGGGSSLAYAIYRPTAARSVCAIMPMTDFAAWGTENPKYGEQVAAAYGGTPSEKPEIYKRNAAVANIDTFANIPVLLFHGTADPTVSVEHSRRLADALKAKGYPCTFYPIDGLAHSSSVISDHQSQIVEFFEASMTR